MQHSQRIVPALFLIVVSTSLSAPGSSGAASTRTNRATLSTTGQAVAPPHAPATVRDLIAAGNRIARTPYAFGGGHAGFEASAYDCSGSVSFVLHAAGLLDAPIDSSHLAAWGTAGAGRWISIYANRGHAYLTVAGLRFDTSARHRTGNRWTTIQRLAHGYRVRHAPRL